MLLAALMYEEDIILWKGQKCSFQMVWCQWRDSICQYYDISDITLYNTLCVNTYLKVYIYIMRVFNNKTSFTITVGQILNFLKL